MGLENFVGGPLLDVALSNGCWGGSRLGDEITAVDGVVFVDCLGDGGSTTATSTSSNASPLSADGPLSAPSCPSSCSRCCCWKKQSPAVALVSTSAFTSRFASSWFPWFLSTSPGKTSFEPLSLACEGSCKDSLLRF